MSIDLTFNPNFNGFVFSIFEQSDGKIIAGGTFSTVGGITKRKVARINSDGSVDSTFNDPNFPNNNIWGVASQSDGEVSVGGEFLTVDGTARERYARLNSDGSLDSAIDSSMANGAVRCVAVQSDGKILISGYFTHLLNYTIERRYLARLNADGTFDTSFNANITGGSVVFRVLLQSDDKIIIGGDFTAVGGTSRKNLARLNSDGSLDTTFGDANLNFFASSLGLQSDGRVVIGGAFTLVGAVTRNRIARLNSDGTLDTGFDAAASAEVRAVAVQSDGKIMIGGSFTTVNTVTRNYIARLNSDGTLDTDFNPAAGNAVYSLVKQQDGNILIGGTFTNIGGETRNRMARWVNVLPLPAAPTNLSAIKVRRA